MTSGERTRAQLVFGAADGVTLGLGLIVGLMATPHALVHGAASAGLAELPGMAAGAWLANKQAGLIPAAANGLAAFAACLIPALPYLFLSGAVALAVAVALVVAVAAVVAWLRPEHGLAAVGQTFGVLAAAAVLCYAASLI